MLETAIKNPLKPAPKGNHSAKDPLQALGANADPSIDDLIETLMAWSQQAFGSEEIVAAREQFYTFAGKVFHDDPFYETRINYFFDFFLLERPLSTAKASRIDSPPTPLSVFLRHLELGEIKLPAVVVERFQQLARFRHGLFQVLKVKDQEMVVRDLLSQEKIKIVSKTGETYRCFAKKDLLQTFIFQKQNDAQLSQGVIQHPPKAARTIKKRLKIDMKDPLFSLNATLSKLARQQLRFLRHRHVDAVLLYQTDPR